MRIFTLGENALTVEFGDEISPELNNAAISLAKRIEADPFMGFIECVPAYASTTVFYDPVRVKSPNHLGLTPYETVREIIKPLLAVTVEEGSHAPNLIEIPVSFDRSDALDLAEMAERLEIVEDEIIGIFLSGVYRVYMFGFLPGFAYMGEVDEQIASPRRSSPRLKVPKGSVGIAGRQTGIYPLESPGGWQIIGRTKLELFDPERDSPCLLSAGDEVRFVSE